FPAGGSADVQSRVIAEGLGAALGQPVVVENKPGAGGNIAAGDAAHAAPDGYTLFMATTGTHATNINLYNNLTGSALVHVPYRGQGPALNDLPAGRIDVMYPLIADTFSFLQARQLK